MKKDYYPKLLLLLAMMLVGCLATNAHDFEVGGIYYNRTGSNTVSVTYYGTNHWSAEYSGDVVIPEIVNYEGTSYTVTGIYEWAFSYCESLTNITLPNTLTSIGNYAFYSCGQLSEISFPSQLASIGIEAFYCCSTITRIVIPRSLVTINSEAFGHCAKVTSIEVENGNPKYDSRNNCNAIIETASNTIVRGCENTIIPNTITTIGNYAFDGCYGLKTMVIPNSVTSLGYSAFNGCIAMTNVTIPNSVRTINSRAFRYCKSLTSITIPNSITKIETDLFYNCISLATINLPNTITEIGSGAFYNTAWYNNQPDGVVYVNQIVYKYKGNAPTGTSLTINDGTRSIIREAFTDCKGLREIIIPNSVRDIGYQAFKGCTNLQNAVIGDSEGEQRMKIQDEAFSGCTALSSVTIGNSVSYLDNEAFTGCNNLKTVNIFDIESWLNVDLYVGYYDYSNPFPHLEHLYLNGSEIEHLVIPNTVNGIRSYAFYNCQRLKTIDIPNTVSDIGYGAFYLCDSITSIICRASNPPVIYDYYSSGNNRQTFSSYTATVQVPQDFLADYQSDSKWSNFSNIIGFNDRFSIDSINFLITSTNTVSVISHNLEYEYEKELIIPEHVDFEGVTYAVTAINDEAFSGCSFLKRVVIPNTVITIGTSAFASCYELREVIIGNSVISIGNSAFRGCEYLHRVTLGNSVVSIGDYAFAHEMFYPDYESEYGPYELLIPGSVESIGDQAFSGWWKFSSINLRSVKTIGQGAFSGCYQLTKVVLGSNLISIGRGAFACRHEPDWYWDDPYMQDFWENVSNLTLDIICMAPVPPTCVNNLVGDFLLDKTRLFVLRDALDDYVSAQVWSDIPQCYPIESEYNFDVDFIVDGICYLINEDNDHEVKVVPFTTYGDGYYIYDIPFYSGDITIPEVVNYGGQDYTVTSIDGTFAETGIISISLPCSMTRIDNYAFSRCTYLRSVHLPNTITEIGEYAFSECASLTEINIPNSLEEIGNCVFENCKSLTSIYIPASIYNIWSSAFYGCSSLSHIEVSSDNGTFDSRDNCNAIIETSTNTLTLGCKNTTIPNSVTRIGDAAFSGCSGLVSINIPNSVTSIGWSAFSGCSNLTNIELPLNLTSIEPDAFYECSALTSIIIPNSVTSIGDGAFTYCYSLTNIVLPINLTSIGSGTFYYCRALTSINIPNTVTSIGQDAFSLCSSLTNIELPLNLTSIESGTFYYCRALTSINIPNTVTSIGNEAFEDCSSLTGINIPNSVTSIGDEAFYDCNNLADISIPNSVVSVGADAFSSTKWFSNQPDGLVYTGRVAYKYKGTMPSDTNIELRDDIVSISSRAFRNCKGLVNIIIPATLSVIGSYAFYGCTGLTGIEFPNSVTSIESYAFYGCTGFTSIELPNSVTSIGGSAFYGCTGLNSVTCWALTPPKMNYNCFSSTTYSSAELWVPAASVSAYKAAYEWKRFTNVFGILSVGDIIEVDGIFYQIDEENTLSVVGRGEGNNPYSGDIVVPDSIDYYGTGFIVTSIAKQAFQDCDELASISMPNSVLSIGNNAFDGCAALNGVVIPDSVTTIGEQAFQGCTGLTSLTIGSSVTSIGAKAFNYCNALKTVISKNEVPPVMANTNCFTNSGYKATLKVPQEAIETYRVADYWYKFSKIESIAEPGDMNGDGKLTITDVSSLIDQLLSGDELPDYADLNGDGKVGIDDVSALISMLLNSN